MPVSKNTGTGEKPLQFAKILTDMVNGSFLSGEFINKVTSITRDLLRFWFSDTFADARKINFHSGQRQAILNTIYVHEILKSKNVFDMYTMIDEDTLSDMGIGEIGASKYNYPKYCMKMATGTGKTWVMHALLIWQYLNAKYEDGEKSGLYSKNFLLVAPGLIVYDRLLDAYLYTLVSDSMFYQFKANGASAEDILKFATIKKFDIMTGQLVLTDLDN
jgi:type III restriction enzyme